MTKQTLIDLDVDLSEDDIQKMLYHINQLEEIRRNHVADLSREFSKRQPRMLEFLKDLEESAVQLDRMSKGAKISSVAGSSVGAVGGVLSIVGLALIPVTFGMSSGLLIAGISLGVTSGVNSAVTTVTEIGVNRKHQKKASEVFQSFMEDVQSLQGCMEEVTRQTVAKMEASEIDVVVGVGKVLHKARAIGKAAGRVASDIPDIGQAAVKGPLALSKSARAGFITLNALFLGMDIFFICKDSISLAKKAVRLKSHSSSETELHFGAQRWSHGRRSETPFVRVC
ncbi:uncharacterized protein AKAME5_002438200 [Lates japonicus]|uniref:Uncharacterized protein n=1 Tax=Lates japonicus TaxID=270547 RepID=A0AAD3NJI9_LATJO|nr:uncharacterized protein AKAME5_002438200 [Lates japonicus]